MFDCRGTGRRPGNGVSASELESRNAEVSEDGFGRWADWDWADFASEVLALASAFPLSLACLGPGPGARVPPRRGRQELCLPAPPRPELPGSGPVEHDRRRPQHTGELIRKPRRKL